MAIAQPHRTDEWITPPEIVDLVIEQWGAIDLDPCAHAESAASKAATLTYDLRRGEDGLALAWPAGARVWLNPPYARYQVKRWSEKAAAHVASGGECLILLNAQVGAHYWRTIIWPSAAAVCVLSPRVAFIRDGVAMPTVNSMDSVVVYMGPNVERFCDVWKARGTIITVKTLQTSPAANDAASTEVAA